jgi:hypothetical protein
MDLRYELIKGRLRELSVEELQRIVDNIDKVCFDEFNYDATSNRYCPLAVAMCLDKILNPSDALIKEEIKKRFSPVNILKGIEGNFYRENRKEDLINLCKNLIKIKTFSS